MSCSKTKYCAHSLFVLNTLIFGYTMEAYSDIQPSAFDHQISTFYLPSIIIVFQLMVATFDLLINLRKYGTSIAILRLFELQTIDKVPIG